MHYLIIAFGLAIALAGVVLLINPEKLFGILRKNFEHPAIHILAVVIRLVLGGLLIYLAGQSRFPPVIEILGWLSIIAALVLAVIGRSRFKRMLSWALSLVKPLGRVSGFAALILGVFLVYSFT
jgi:hypothetical protein